MSVELEPRPKEDLDEPYRKAGRRQPAPAESPDLPAPPAAISRKTRRWAMAAGLITILLIVAAIVIVIGQINAKMAAAAEAKAAMTAPNGTSQRVAVLELKGVPFEDKLSLPGALSPWVTVKISSESIGPVVDKLVDEGQRVEQGQIIFKIDTDTLQTELDLAQTRLALAQKQLERTRALFAQNFATREKLDEDESAVEQERANVRLRQLRLDKATIEAPISGVINRIDVERGDYVREGQQLCEIIQTDRLKMIVGVPEKDIVYLSEGQPVPVTVDALRAKTPEPLQGMIHRILPAADEATRTFTVEVAIDEPGPFVRPGMIARAELTRRTLDSAILIPIFSVMRHSEGYAVYVEREGVAQRRIVTIGSFLPQGLQIESGLESGDNLIIRGQRDLVDGDSVDVVRRIGPEVFDLAARLGMGLSNSDIENFLDDYMNEPAGAAAPAQVN